MMMLRTCRKLLFVVTALTLVFASCKSHKEQASYPGQDPKLEGRRWVLRRLNGAELKGTKEQTLSFESANNMVNGNGGCNTMNGMYTVQDEMIKILPMATTERACTDLADQQREAAFWKAITDTDRYKLRKKMVSGVNKEILELMKDKTVLAEFEAVYLN